MIKDKFIWVSKNQGNKDDRLLLAGEHNKSGYHIACLIDFIKSSFLPYNSFSAFREDWERKYEKETDENES